MTGAVSAVFAEGGTRQRRLRLMAQQQFGLLAGGKFQPMAD
jgi:hypothetical protein